jgi:hypothetical protein
MNLKFILENSNKFLKINEFLFMINEVSSNLEIGVKIIIIQIHI